MMATGGDLDIADRLPEERPPRPEPPRSPGPSAGTSAQQQGGDNEQSGGCRPEDGDLVAESYDEQDDHLFRQIVEDGDASCISWEDLRTKVKKRLDFNVDRMSKTEAEKGNELKDADEVQRTRRKIEQVMHFMTKAPWTIQRVCELVVDPKYYSLPVKYLRAFEKVITVTSGFDEFPLQIDTGDMGSCPSPSMEPTAELPPLSQAVGPRFDLAELDLETRAVRPVSAASPAGPVVQVDDPMEVG